MGVIDIKKGEILHRRGDHVGTLDIILKGNVKISTEYSSVSVSNGGILGILESPGGSYSYEYTALEDTSLYISSFHSLDDIEKVILSNPKISNILASTAVKAVSDVFTAYNAMVQEANSFYQFLKKSYQDYTSLCERFSVPVQSFSYIEELVPFSMEEEIPSWVPEYYKALKAIPAETRTSYYGHSAMVSVGTIMQSVRTVTRIISFAAQVADYMSETTSYLINDVGGDFFDLYSNLVFKASQNPFNDTTPIEAAVSKIIIYLENSKFLDQTLLSGRIEEYRQGLHEIEDMLLQDTDTISTTDKAACDSITDSLNTILSYAEYDEEQAADFTDLVERYKKMADKNSTEDDARMLRRYITDHFYSIYEAALLKSADDPHVPTVLKMFFYFGYMDEELAGTTNATQLYALAENMTPDDEGQVLPVYDWLLMILNGDEEPSKNEFDLDYPAAIREQRSSGSISTTQEHAMLNDRHQKLHFEIQNMFKSVNRITFGRVTTFCPLLSEHNILRPLKNIFLTPKTVHTVFNNIRSIDYSCYYRETIFSDPEIGITREYIQKEVLPYVILMPNVGIRGSLWQEVAGPRRDTPARMMLSIFPTEDVNDTLTRLSGEFRWELCKRVQGVHWNDVTDRSLTSEYCDYIQFYRKNHDLSQDTKDKIKISLQKAKNNYREVFVMDYVAWVKYEGTGSPRLNRFARNILFTYCPFTAKLRKELQVNPMYTDLIDRFNIRIGQKKHMMDVLYQKLSNAGTPVPEDIQEQRAYLDR